MREDGLMKHSTRGCALVADGDRWLNKNEIWRPNEAATHRVIDVLGDLALAS